MKKDKKMPMFQALKLNIRALMVIYQKFPQMVLSRLILQSWLAITPYVGIYLSALVIDELGGSKNPERLKTLVLITLASAVLIGLISALLTKWKNTQDAGKLYKLEYITSLKLFNMDFADVDSTETHNLLSAIRQSMASGGWGLFKIIALCEQLLSALFMLAGGFTLTVSLFTSKVPESAGAYTILNHPMFILLIAAVMLAITLLSPLLSNKSKSYWAVYADEHRLGNTLYTFLEKVCSNRDKAEDVRIYRQEVIANKFFRNKEAAFCSQGFFAKISRGPMGLYGAASAAVSVVFTGAAYVFVCLKAIAGAFGLGAVTQYVAAITRAAKGMAHLVSSSGEIRSNAPFLEQVFAFLDIPNNMYQGSLTVEKRRDRNYEVEFKNVSFKYPGSENYSLRNVNIKFKVGERLAVVGMNGSGKTTFIKLLCRLYDPTEGEILLNGINIKKYNYLDYMMIFSVVFQDFKLFALKLGENVASGADCDRNLAADCLEKAGFGERLAKLPDGLDTYLYTSYNKDGVNISGGEAQKIAIARALYKNAPFIILDEPTAALDPIAEAEIYSKFDEIAGDKTAIYISHRLSSCKFCDEIAVFHQGSVIQQGTHEELVSDVHGKYYELWNAQAQYYTEP